jgi:hypothetical protein
MTRNAANSKKEDFPQKFKIVVRKDAKPNQGLKIAMSQIRGVTQNEFDCCAGCLENVHKPNDGAAMCSVF